MEQKVNYSEAVANSMATTIVSGGHLTSALKQQGLADKINHISTAGWCTSTLSYRGKVTND